MIKNTIKVFKDEDGEEIEYLHFITETQNINICVADFFQVTRSIGADTPLESFLTNNYSWCINDVVILDTNNSKVSVYLKKVLLKENNVVFHAIINHSVFGELVNSTFKLAE